MHDWHKTHNRGNEGDRALCALLEENKPHYHSVEHANKSYRVTMKLPPSAKVPGARFWGPRTPPTGTLPEQVREELGIQDDEEWRRLSTCGCKFSCGEDAHACCGSQRDFSDLSPAQQHVWNTFAPDIRRQTIKICTFRTSNHKFASVITRDTDAHTMLVINQ